MDVTKIAFCPITGCHLWVACIDSLGYGNVWNEGKMKKSHRVAYEEAYGPIPKGLVIDHLCRVRSCCNPDHLRAVTQRENVFAKDSRCPAKKNAEKTHCGVCGSEFSMTTNGWRGCVPCFKAKRVLYMREWNAKRRDGGV